jgi:hypothetical protein
LSRIELRRDEVTGMWRKLHNEELNVLYSSPNIIRVIEFRVGDPRERNLLEDLGLDGKTILKWILQ